MYFKEAKWRKLTFKFQYDPIAFALALGIGFVEKNLFRLQIGLFRWLLTFDIQKDGL